MAFICKQSSMCKVFLRHRAFGCNFVGNRDITVNHRTFAEGKENAVNNIGRNQLTVKKGVQETQVEKNLMKPTDVDKVMLMWNRSFQASDDIPEYVRKGQLKLAYNMRRIVIFVWIITTLTLFLFTIIQCGEYRRRKLLLLFHDEQNKIWESRKEANERNLIKLNEDSKGV